MGPLTLRVEQEHHQKAFELYHTLGARRTYQSVASQMGVSPSAVKLWSRSFGWRARIRERDAATARQLADRVLHDGVDDRLKQHKIVQMAMMRLAKAIADGKVRMQLADLDRLIRLKAFLEGYDEAKGMGRKPEEIADFLNMLGTQTFERVVEILEERNKGAQ